MLYNLNEPGYPFDIFMSVSGLSDKTSNDIAGETLKITCVYPVGDNYNWFRPKNAFAIRSIVPEQQFKFVRIQVDADFNRQIEAVFSTELVHSDVLDALVYVAFDYCHGIGHCIAAGFTDGEGTYWGRSDSIGIDCKGNS